MERYLTARGFSYNQPRLDNYIARRPGASPPRPSSESRRPAGRSRAALVDGGERHAQQVRVVHVAHADHFDLLGNARCRLRESPSSRRPRWDRCSRRSRRAAGSSASSRRAASISAGIVGGMHDVAVGHRDARGGQCLLVALQPAQRRWSAADRRCARCGGSRARSGGGWPGGRWPRRRRRHKDACASAKRRSIRT